MPALVDPFVVAGNPKCSDLVAAGHLDNDAGLSDFKIDPVPDTLGQTYTYAVAGAGTITITITGVDGESFQFSWTSTFGIDAIFVKGGPEGGNLYNYQTLTAEPLTDSGLLTPTNPKNGKPSAISHISFCYDLGDDPGPTNFIVRGQKFEDIDGDGQRDIGENTPPPGNTWVIRLDNDTDETNGFFQHMTTDAVTGTFQFNNVAAGTYFVYEVEEDGYTNTLGKDQYRVVVASNGTVTYTNLTDNSNATQADFGNFENIDISGLKYTDENGDGSLVGDSAGTPGQTFTIDLYKWTDAGTLDGVVQDGELVFVSTTETNATTGAYSFTNLGPLPAGTRYYVREAGETGWTQTFGNAGYTTAALSGEDDTNNHFGNFENIDICGNKFYDHDTDGVDDGAGDEGVAGLRIFLDGSNGGIANGTYDVGELFTLTDANGDYCFTNLGPGTYTVLEDLTSLTGTWIQTTTNPAPITATSGDDVDGIDFGNIKLVGSGGLTIGFWGNKNGLKLLTQTDFAGLTALNLRNADGSARDFTGTLAQNKAALDTWLQNANAVNMAYMLSAQLAATYLNSTVDINPTLAGVQTAIANTSALVYVPGVIAHNPQGSALEGNLNSGPNPTLVSSNHTVSIQAIIDAANAALGADGDVGAGDPARPYYEALKIVLDALNNNDNIVIA